MSTLYKSPLPDLYVVPKRHLYLGCETVQMVSKFVHFVQIVSACSPEGGNRLMKKQRSWKEYRAIDLSILALMLAIFEFLIINAAKFWFPNELYTVSLAAAVTSIVYMRWGAWGGIHAVEAGLVYSYFAGGTPEQYIIYCAGNLFSLLAVLLLKTVGKEKVRTGKLSLVFPVLVQLLMHLGRGVMALVFGAGFGSMAAFITADSLSYVFTFVIIWIARRLDGVYEDQKHYLLRISTERE